MTEQLFNASDNPIHADTFSYDSRNKPLWRRAVYEDNTYAHRFDYAHDVQGNLTNIVSSTPSGASTVMTYDELNRLSSVAGGDDPGTPVVSYAYDFVGNLHYKQYANALSHIYDYDALNRLKTMWVVNSASDILQAHAYTLDPNGRRTSAVEMDGRTVGYTYDDLGRLVQEHIIAGTNNPGLPSIVDYTYDAVGNRLSRSPASFIDEQSFLYTANDWLDSDTYDSNGNTVEAEVNDPQASGLKSTAFDQYDFRNRLIRRTLDDGTILDYTYNARGTRISKVKKLGAALISTRLFVVDEQNLTGYAQTIEEWSAAGYDLLTLDKVYTYGLDLAAQTQFEFDAQTSSFIPHISYFLYDGHGNVRGLADEFGIVTDAYAYDAFGILLEQAGTTENAYRYCGEYFDSGLGMYFLRARYMEPDRGRFWTMDTYEGNSFDPPSLHKYLYCHADPVNGIDPSGNMTTLSEVMVSNAIIGSFAGFYTGLHATRTLSGALRGALLGGLAGTITGGATWFLTGAGATTITAAHLSLSAALSDSAVQVIFLYHGRPFNPRQTVVVATASYFSPGLAIVLKGSAGLGLGEATTFLHALSSAITQIVADAVNAAADHLGDE